MPFTESNYENAVLQLFTQTLGYAYAYGPDIERDYHSPLYEDELLPALRAVNPALPQAALDDAVWMTRCISSKTSSPVPSCRKTGSLPTICKTACRSNSW